MIKTGIKDMHQCIVQQLIGLTGRGLIDQGPNVQCLLKVVEY